MFLTVRVQYLRGKRSSDFIVYAEKGYRQGNKNAIDTYSVNW